MLKRCQNCGVMFETKKGNRRLCEDCKGYRATNKPKVKQSIPLIEMSAIIEKHNRTYGTSYTYGEFEKLLESKKIFILDGESFEKR